VVTWERVAGVEIVRFSTMQHPKSLYAALLAVLFLAGCATESSRTLETPKVAAAATAHHYAGAKAALVVGKFDNKSNYMRGLFSDGVDRLGSQAKTILISHLQQTGRFSVMDRENMDEGKREAAIAGREVKIKGASYTVTGDVTDFGRKESGDHELFGLLGSGKKQIAYSKVTLNVVDVMTSEVVFSAMGAGEYALSNREIIGFGSTANYDSTLNGKVLDLAMRQAVDKLVQGMEEGKWGASR